MSVENSNRKPAESIKTVLVVDDEFGIRDFLYAYLKTKGFRVLTAESGEEALNIWDAENGQIDLVLTDMLMPGMDGHVLARRLTERAANVKIIFMSGYMGDVSEQSLGHPFLRKPFQPHQLLETIRKRLER